MIHGQALLSISRLSIPYSYDLRALNGSLIFLRTWRKADRYSFPTTVEKIKRYNFSTSLIFEILLLQHKGKHKHQARNNDDRFWKGYCYEDKICYNTARCAR